MNNRVVGTEDPAICFCRRTFSRKTPGPIYKLGETALETSRPAFHSFPGFKPRQDAVGLSVFELNECVCIRLAVTACRVAREIAEYFQLGCDSINQLDTAV